MPKVWFITGSSRGLGLAIAEHALQNGDHVAATARTASAAALTRLTATYGDEAMQALSLDVTDAAAASAAVQAAVAKFRRIDIVVNAAGYATPASFEDTPLAGFRAQLETNFMGVVNVTKAIVPVLRAQGSGHVFQVSSVGGRVATPGLTAYQSSKWAIGGFSLGLAAELAPLGVRVTVLEPGGIRTAWAANASLAALPVSAPYQATVGEFAKVLCRISGNEASDPRKFGAVIEELYRCPDPPLRMLVGPDAVELWAEAAEALAVSDEKWKELSLSSAF